MVFSHRQITSLMHVDPDFVLVLLWLAERRPPGARRPTVAAATAPTSGTFGTAAAAGTTGTGIQAASSQSSLANVAASHGREEVILRTPQDILLLLENP